MFKAGTHFLESAARNRMSRVLLLLTLVLAVATTSATEAQTTDSRPNILFVFTDDHSTRAVAPMARRST